MPEQILSPEEIKAYKERQKHSWKEPFYFLKQQLIDVVDAYQRGESDYPEKMIGWSDFNWAWVRAHLPKTVVKWFESNIKSESGKKKLRKELFKQTNPEDYNRLYYPASSILTRLKETYAKNKLSNIWGKDIYEVEDMFRNLTEAYLEGNLSKSEYVKKFKELDRKLSKTKELYKKDKVIANSSYEYLLSSLEAEKRRALAELTSDEKGIEVLRKLLKKEKK